MVKLRSIASGSERRASPGIPISYASLTSWPDPVFVPVRVRPFTTKAELDSLLSTIAAGDFIFYNGTGTLTITTTSSGYNNFSNKNPTGVAEIHLGHMNETNHVKFQYTGTANFPAVWVHDSSHLHMFGGEMSTPNGGGTGVIVQGEINDLLWWDWVSHDTGGGGFGMSPGKPDGTDVTTHKNCWIRGEIYNWAQHFAWDGHFEPGTGIHACNLADLHISKTTMPGYGNSGNFFDNIVAIYAHNGLGGAAMELGEVKPNTGKTGGDIHNNQLYVKADTITMDATIQVASNAINLWGSVNLVDTVIGWIEGINLRGRVVDGQGLSGAQYVNGGKVTVNHGRHVNTNQNPNLGSTESGVSPTQPYDDRWGITYNDCT